MLYYSLVYSASDCVHVMLFRREQSSESRICFQSQMETFGMHVFGCIQQKEVIWIIGQTISHLICMVTKSRVLWT